MVDRDFYEKRAEAKYPTSSNPETEALVGRIGEWCKPRPRERVLDFGCYDGYILRVLQREYGVEGVGVDLSIQALNRARELSSELHIQFAISNGDPLPFPSDSFDIVICSEILEHVPDLDRVLSEVSRVVARGGRVYATMPNSLRHVWPPLRSICRKVDRIEGHVRRLTRDEFVSTMRRHQLTVSRAQYRGFAASALWYSLLIYRPHTKRRAVSMISRPTLQSRMLRFLALAATSGYLTVDRQFRRYRGCMGIDAAFVKQ